MVDPYHSVIKSFPKAQRGDESIELLAPIVHDGHYNLTYVRLDRDDLCMTVLDSYPSLDSEKVDERRGELEGVMRGLLEVCGDLQRHYPKDYGPHKRVKKSAAGLKRWADKGSAALDVGTFHSRQQTATGCGPIVCFWMMVYMLCPWWMHENMLVCRGDQLDSTNYLARRAVLHLLFGGPDEFMQLWSLASGRTTWRS